jgi:hypothetical protein
LQPPIPPRLPDRRRQEGTATKPGSAPISAAAICGPVSAVEAEDSPARGLGETARAHRDGTPFPTPGWQWRGPPRTLSRAVCPRSFVLPALRSRRQSPPSPTHHRRHPEKSEKGPTRAQQAGTERLARAGPSSSLVGPSPGGFVGSGSAGRDRAVRVLAFPLCPVLLDGSTRVK